MSKSKDGNAVEGVLKYLIGQNRPYSVNDVVQNLHKEFGKTAVQKAVDVLVMEKKLKEKTYGKQKVYCVDQNLFPEIDEKELAQMDAEIAKLTEEIKKEELESKKVDQQLKELNSTLTTQEAKKSLNEISAQIEKLKVKLKSLSETQIQIPEEEKRQIQTENESSVKAWRKRKRICMDIAESILENYPKPKRELLEEMGIETDEELGLQLPKQ
ncbi:homologous-pairing protein 2 homolog [Artemia franciscana]|uniref:Homologous-pairing protein 2 homolog n=1 Tax=Artemia franciscana TaxID=6661 RepID=A0AA88I2Q5_ARTSF|nr:hypothetical protein QYM36_007295 [Artemia franciscana]